jgi:hypothetical protein
VGLGAIASYFVFAAGRTAFGILPLGIAVTVLGLWIRHYGRGQSR